MMRNWWKCQIPKESKKIFKNPKESQIILKKDGNAKESLKNPRKSQSNAPLGTSFSSHKGEKIEEKQSVNYREERSHASYSITSCRSCREEQGTLVTLVEIDSSVFEWK